MLIKKSKIKIIRCLIALMDICVYVHVNKIIRCEYNNGGGGLCWGGGGGGASDIRQTWGGTCPESLKIPVLEYWIFKFSTWKIGAKTKVLRL